MSISAQMQHSRGHRRDARADDVTVRDIKAEAADARDRRNNEPFHLWCDAEADARQQANAAHDRYQDQLREYGLPMRLLAELFDPVPTLLAAECVLEEAERLNPNPQDEADGLGDWIREGALEQIERTCRLQGWRSPAQAFDALEGFARGAYGRELATRARTLLDATNPWILIAYARSLRGLREIAGW